MRNFAFNPHAAKPVTQAEINAIIERDKNRNEKEAWKSEFGGWKATEWRNGELYKYTDKAYDTKEEALAAL